MVIQKLPIDPLQLTSPFENMDGHANMAALFCVCGDYSFYGDLGKHSHAPTMLLVCVELNEMWLIDVGHVSIDTTYEANVNRYSKMAASG